MALLKQMARGIGYWESSTLYVEMCAFSVRLLYHVPTRYHASPVLSAVFFFIITTHWLLHRHVHVLQGPPLAEPGTSQGPFPVVLFSHGVGSNRSTYSLLAADIASRGAVVVCVEHVDGTACGARLAYDSASCSCCL